MSAIGLVALMLLSLALIFFGFYSMMRMFEHPVWFVPGAAMALFMVYVVFFSGSGTSEVGYSYRGE